MMLIFGGILWLLALAIQSGNCQFGDDKVYLGKRIGKFSTYHHQVQGEVFALDERTVFIKGFTYDGNGPDAFFWAGTTDRPGNQGFLIQNEVNRTNVLKAYHNRDIRLTMPDGKRITDIKWLSIFDLSLSVTYGDVLIPQGFEPPTPQVLVEFSRENHGVKSKPVVIMDTKTLLIPGLYYDGLAPGARFWIGTGTQVSPNGRITPDEDGYLGPLRRYMGEDVTLQLPGNTTVFDIEYLSIYDINLKENFGSIMIRGELNVPLARMRVIPNENRLPNCEQLHTRLQVSWEIFGSKITVQIAAKIGEYDYMAFGISGADNGTQMIGSDTVVTHMEGLLGFAVDYNMTDRAACSGTSGSLRGVCPDILVGGIEDVNKEAFVREDGITKITYVRFLIPADPGDKPIEDKNTFVVWALGHLGKSKQPQYHYHYSKDDFKINFHRSPPQKNCFYFTEGQEIVGQPWSTVRVPGETVNFTAMLGPSGGQRGYEGMTGQNSSGLAWYINGYMAPEIYMKRGKKYTFSVYGGNDPNRPQFYHPFYITDDPRGGYELLSSAERKKIRVYAGVDFDRRTRPIPTAVGKLCWWTNDSLDLRRTDSFPTFSRFRNNLQLVCEEGEPAILVWVPNSTTPETVYYQSFRQPNMGWKINVVDSIPVGAAPKSAEQLPCLIFFVQLIAFFTFIS